MAKYFNNLLHLPRPRHDANTNIRGQIKPTRSAAHHRCRMRRRPRVTSVGRALGLSSVAFVLSTF